MVYLFIWYLVEALVIASGMFIFFHFGLFLGLLFSLLLICLVIWGGRKLFWFLGIGLPDKCNAARKNLVARGFSVEGTGKFFTLLSKGLGWLVALIGAGCVKAGFSGPGDPLVGITGVPLIILGLFLIAIQMDEDFGHMSLAEQRKGHLSGLMDSIFIVVRVLLVGFGAGMMLMGDPASLEIGVFAIFCAIVTLPFKRIWNSLFVRSIPPGERREPN